MVKVYFLGALIVLSGCQSRPLGSLDGKDTSAPTNSSTKHNEKTGSVPDKALGQNWSVEMQQLAKSFEELIPYMYSDTKFQNPLNKKDLEGKIDNFRKNVSHISPDEAKQMYGKDPLMLKGLENLKEIASRSLGYFQMGKANYAQNLLKQSAKYCFQCHTRTETGPQHLYWSKFNIDKYELQPHEKAQIFVAMRQYDKAKDELKKLLETPSADNGRALLFEQDIKYFLLISIRGQSNFEEAATFISEQAKNEKLSKNFRANLTTWRKDLTTWTKKFSQVPHTITEAKKVLALQKIGGELNEAQFVKAIVAALMIHEGLAEANLPAQQAESYYYLGRIYEYFTVGGFWDVSDLYYEMCVNAHPHSKMAQSCVARLRESTVIKNTGAQGFIIPEVEVRRLKDLEAKATPDVSENTPNKSENKVLKGSDENNSVNELENKSEKKRVQKTNKKTNDK